ncbi:hypothetical protein D3C80_1624960 [compost metagenome]
MKREHDRDLSSFVAAPATVSGEPENKKPLVWRMHVKSKFGFAKFMRKNRQTGKVFSGYDP